MFGGTAFATGAGFVLKILVGRQLGTAALGVFGMCYGALVVVSTLSDLGIRYSLITLASKRQREEPEQARALVAAGLALKLLAGILGLGAGWVLAPWAAEALFRKPELAPYLRMTSVGLLLWGMWDGIEGALQSAQRFRDAAALKILIEGARLLSFLALWLTRDGLFLSPDRFMVLYMGAPLLAVGAGALLLRGSLHPWPGGSRAGLGTLLSFAPGVFFYRTFSMVLVFMDSLLLTRYGDLGAVGQFEAAKGLAFAILLVSESLGMVLLPKVNQLGSLAALKSLLRRFTLYFALVSAVALAWLLLAGRLLALFGPAFHQPTVVHTFQLLVLTTLFTLPATTLGVVLLALNRPGVLGRVAALQVLLGLASYPVTIVQGGLLGTAATTAALQLAGLLMLTWALRAEIAGRSDHPEIQGGSVPSTAQRQQPGNTG